MQAEGIDPLRAREGDEEPLPSEIASRESGSPQPGAREREATG